jgi:hypothetical protein
MADNYFLVPVVGLHFHPPALQIILELAIGTKLTLIREPDNKYDKNAIKVLLPGFSSTGEHADVYARYGCKAEDEGNLIGDLLHLGYIASKTGEAGILSAEFDKLEISSWEAMLISQKGNLVVVMLRLDASPEGLRRASVKFSASDRERLRLTGGGDDQAGRDRSLQHRTN